MLLSLRAFSSSSIAFFQSGSDITTRWVIGLNIFYKKHLNVQREFKVKVNSKRDEGRENDTRNL